MRGQRLRQAKQRSNAGRRRLWHTGARGAQAAADGASRVALVCGEARHLCHLARGSHEEGGRQEGGRVAQHGQQVRGAGDDGAQTKVYEQGALQVGTGGGGQRRTLCLGCEQGTVGSSRHLPPPAASNRSPAFLLAAPTPATAPPRSHLHGTHPEGREK